MTPSLTHGADTGSQERQWLLGAYACLILTPIFLLSLLGAIGIGWYFRTRAPTPELMSHARWIARTGIGALVVGLVVFPLLILVSYVYFLSGGMDRDWVYVYLLGGCALGILAVLWFWVRACKGAWFLLKNRPI